EEPDLDVALADRVERVGEGVEAREEGRVRRAHRGVILPADPALDVARAEAHREDREDPDRPAAIARPFPPSLRDLEGAGRILPLVGNDHDGPTTRHGGFQGRCGAVPAGHRTYALQTPGGRGESRRFQRRTDRNGGRVQGRTVATADECNGG